jgi:hypothetical protein
MAIGYNWRDATLYVKSRLTSMLMTLLLRHAPLSANPSYPPFEWVHLGEQEVDVLQLKLSAVC